MKKLTFFCIFKLFFFFNVRNKQQFANFKFQSLWVKAFALRKQRDYGMLGVLSVSRVY